MEVKTEKSSSEMKNDGKKKNGAAATAPSTEKLGGAPAVEPAKAPQGDQSLEPAGATQASTPVIASPSIPRLAKAAAEKRGLGPKIDPRAAEWLASTWASANEGATWVLEAVPGLYRRTLGELRGKLDANQARLVLDALNGMETGAGLAGQRLGLALRDAVEGGDLPAKWGVDGRQLLRAVNGLTAFQSATIEWWAAQFWQGDVEDVARQQAHVALIAGGCE
jgi:hypothetical protein